MQALAAPSRCAFGSAAAPRAPLRVTAPSRTPMVVVAAVPKKKMSKSKTNLRFTTWRNKVLPYAEKALFLAKLALQQGDGSRDSKDKDMSITGTAAAAPESSPPAEASQ